MPRARPRAPSALLLFAELARRSARPPGPPRQAPGRRRCLRLAGHAPARPLPLAQHLRKSGDAQYLLSQTSAPHGRASGLHVSHNRMSAHRGWGQSRMGSEKKEVNDNRKLGTGDGGRPRRTGARPRAEFKWMAPGFPRVGRAAPLSYLCVYNVVYLRLCCSQERRSASRQQSSEIRSRASTSPRPAKIATSFPRAV